ncbi:hypothetical protein WAI453_004639 [Rhynchosporium graminicola]
MLAAEHILAAVGPISTSLDGCKLFMKTLFDDKPWMQEPFLLLYPWKLQDL